MGSRILAYVTAVCSCLVVGGCSSPSAVAAGDAGVEGARGGGAHPSDAGADTRATKTRDRSRDAAAVDATGLAEREPDAARPPETTLSLSLPLVPAFSPLIHD